MAEDSTPWPSCRRASPSMVVMRDAIFAQRNLLLSVCLSVRRSGSVYMIGPRRLPGNLPGALERVAGSMRAVLTRTHSQGNSTRRVGASIFRSESRECRHACFHLPEIERKREIEIEREGEKEREKEKHGVLIFLPFSYFCYLSGSAELLLVQSKEDIERPPMELRASVVLSAVH